VQVGEGTCSPRRSNITSNPDSAMAQTQLCDSDHIIEKADIDSWIKNNLRDRPKERVSSITSLSSASSCELYTSTDMSDDDPDVGATVSLYSERAIIRVVDIILRKVEVNLRFATYMQCNGGSASNGGSSAASRSQQGNGKSSDTSSKRKSRLDNHLRPNDNEDDGSNKRRRTSLATVESSELGSKFACPFYKHEPSRFHNRRTCPGPGWPTVHRMKEHLYRAHAQPIYCPRCYVMFDADIDLSSHLRSAQCSVTAPQPIEGIDRETLKALRKRSPVLRLEEDRWRDVYHLLFPGVALEDIPSPCTFQHPLLTALDTNTSQSTTALLQAKNRAASAANYSAESNRSLL
jgi:hypothetical protein